MSQEEMEYVKQVLLEHQEPFFTDEQIKTFYSRYGSVNDMLYYMLMEKAQNISFSVSGLQFGDLTQYYRRKARMYEPNNTGILKGN